ncbi:MAG: anthranilate synthase component I family protein [Verrucomicrobiota bacterium]
MFIHRERRWLEIGETSSWFLPARPTFCELGDWDFQPVITRSQFLERVCRAQESIAQGDIYQVNVAQPFRVRAPEGGLLGDPWSFYERLRHHSPAPFSAFFRREETTIVSSSPEEFLHISGRGVRTQPIKGTRPRFRDERRDAASAAELVASSKERAELLMITDLLRNDLGQFCEYGSVSVEKLLDLQAFRHIYHLVSEVRGTMRQGVHPVDVLRLCFPGGSITGAPKRRACEIIREIEGEDRGVYTGAIGYFGFNGVAHFSIAIRTATMQPDWAEFRVGAGIVADSSPVMEYEETLHKAAGMLAAAHDIHRVGDKYPLLQSMSIAS